MKLTGKCKEEFEKWYNEVQKYNIGWFYRLQSEYQYGVLVDYFDSVGLPITIGVYTIRINEAKDWCFQIVGNKHSNQNKLISFERFYNTRPEARTEAIKKANELRNEVLNK